MILYWKQNKKKLSQLPDPDSPWLYPRCEPRPLDWWIRCRRASVLSSLFFPRQCEPWCQCCGFSCRERGKGAWLRNKWLNKEGLAWVREGLNKTEFRIRWTSWIQILPSSRKIVRKPFISTVLWLLYDFLSLKNDVNAPSKSIYYLEKKTGIFFLLLDVLKVTDDKSRIRSRIQDRIC